MTTYTATVTLDGQTYSDTLNLSDLAMLEHTYENGKCTLCGAEDPNDAPFVPSIAGRQRHLAEGAAPPAFPSPPMRNGQTSSGFRWTERTWTLPTTL